MLPADAWSGRNSFHLIRLLLAIAVLYRHSFDLLATGHADVVLDLIPPRTHLGRIALCFFMVISGFLVTISWERSHGWRDFLRRRVLRVYPGFVAASVISAFIVAPLGTSDPVAYLASIDVFGFVVGAAQLNNLGIPPSFLANPYPGPVNGSLWSIKIEFECYLLLMLLALAGALRRRALIVALFAVMVVAHAIQGYVPSSLDRYAHHLQLATFFVAGTVAALYRDRIPRSYTWAEVAALVTLCTAILEVGFLEVLPVTGAYLLLWLAYEPRLATVALTHRVDLSYGIYLYAWPIQQLLVQAAAPSLNPYSLSVAALALSAGAAWLSWQYVERPFLAQKRQRQPVMPRRGGTL